jgi:Fe-S-cluster containining protein
MDDMPDEATTARAQARADKISRRTNWDAVKTFGNLAIKTREPKIKVWYLHKIGDEIVRAAKGFTACDKGCSHCCHQPVMMSLSEARYIGAMTGKTVTTPAEFTLEPAKQYSGVACPFLVQGQCSIYEHRPYTCRLHFSLEDNEDPCKIDGRVGKVLYLNQKEYHELQVLAFQELVLEMQDIRAFFPDLPKTLGDNSGASDQPSNDSDSNVQNGN